MFSYFRYNSDDLYVHFSQDEQPHPYDFKMHTHEQCELYCFFGGKGSFRVEGTNYPLSPGDIIIMRPYEAHYIDIDPSLPYTRSAVQFDSNIFGSADSDGILKKAFFDRETGRLNRYSGAELGLPYKLFTEALTAPVGDHRTLILSRLMPLLHSISVVFDTRSDDDDSDSLEHRIVSFVGSRISDDISLDTICREFYISKPQLCRIFKAATGSGVWEYISRKRFLCRFRGSLCSLALRLQKRLPSADSRITRCFTVRTASIPALRRQKSGGDRLYSRRQHFFYLAVWLPKICRYHL